jgi:hypothetical protein
MEINPDWAKVEKERIAKIDDIEQGHIEEDRFYNKVLTAIAYGDCYDVEEVAKICVELIDMHLQKWYS